MRKKSIRTLSILQSITMVVIFLFVVDANGGEKTFEYDDLGRLISVTSSTENNHAQTTYSYDVVGNRTSKSVLREYAVTITCNENGTSSHNGQFFLEENDTLSVTITPDDGYAVYNVYENPHVLASMWPRCHQSGNSVILTLDNIRKNYDIKIDFYRLTGLVGDVNGDCAVDNVDHGIMAINAHYRTFFKPCDLNGDDRVHTDDLMILLSHMEETCE